MHVEIFLAFFALVFISVGVFALAKRIGVPYTVLLVLAGTALVPMTELPFLAFIRSFELTPELLFFVFLPILIFESAYNMNVREMAENVRSISLLSVLSLVISTVFVALGLFYGLRLVGFEIPFIVALLFGSLISATDPVAVLALFKEYGAPRRLSLIFEGESLFNDGTSLALFFVVLEVFLEGFGGLSSISEGLFLFSTMIIGGIGFGLAMGFLFSKLLEKVTENDFVEITLTMLAAHFTFLLSEVISEHLVLFGHEIKFSSIIATVIAAMVIGNYGRSKMSHSVDEYMEKFWGYFAFVANSLVFILMGLLFAGLPIDFMAFVAPIIITIAIVMIGRAISIYPVIGFLNWTKKEAPIPASWQHLLSWGSLRGALAVTMVLLIPDDATVAGWTYDFSVKEFIAAITIGCIYFTLIIKATTIGRVMKRLGVGSLHAREEAEYHQAKSLIRARAIEKLADFREKGYVTEEVFSRLKEEQDAEYAEACRISRGFYETEKGRKVAEEALRVYAIGIERHFLKVLFRYGEVSEPVYKRIGSKLAVQLSRVEHGEAQSAVSSEEISDDWFEYLVNATRRIFFSQGRKGFSPEEQYMYYRAQEIISRKVQKHLRSFVEQSGYDSFGDRRIFDAVLAQYEEFERGARIKMEACLSGDDRSLHAMREAFGRKGVFKAQEDALDELAENEMITPKLSILLQDELRRKEE